jgi:putative MATE family efflux protein
LKGVVLNNRESLELTHEALNRNIVKLAGPAVLENLLGTMVFFASGLLIGWMRDPVALAAVSMGAQFGWIANSIFDAISVGAIAMIARYWGRQDYERARYTAGQAVVLAVLTAAVVGVLGIVIADEAMALMGLEPDVARQGALYMRLILSTSFLAFPLTVINGTLRGSGDTRTPMWITAIMNVFNIIVAYGLIFGPGPLPAWGVAGAGVATALARALGGGIAFWVILRGKSAIRLDRRHFWPLDRGLLGQMLRLSGPAMGEMVVQRSGSLLFQRIIAALGTVALAAHRIAVNVESLSFMPSFGMSVAISTLVGQSLGARRPELAEASVRRGLVISVVLMVGTGLGFILFGRPIASVFGSTPEVLGLAGMAVQIAALEQPTLAVQMVLAGSLRGAGDTRSPLYVSLVGVILFRVPMVYLLAIVLDWGLAGIWWGTALDWAARSAVSYFLYRRGAWKRVEL